MGDDHYKPGDRVWVKLHTMQPANPERPWDPVGIGVEEWSGWVVRAMGQYLEVRFDKRGRNRMVFSSQLRPCEDEHLVWRHDKLYRVIWQHGRFFRQRGAFLQDGLLDRCSLAEPQEVEPGGWAWVRDAVFMHNRQLIAENSMMKNITRIHRNMRKPHVMGDGQILLTHGLVPLMARDMHNALAGAEVDP